MSILLWWWITLSAFHFHFAHAQSSTVGPSSLSSLQTESQTQSSRTIAASGGPSASLTVTVVGTSTVSITSSGTSNLPVTSASSTSTAQYPSLSGVPVCVTQCLQGAVSAANCSSIIDVNCFCKSEAFVDTVTECVALACYNQVTEAQQLAQRFCNIASTSLTFPPATSPTLAPSPSAPLSTTSISSAAGACRGVGVRALGMVIGMVTMFG